MKISKYIFLISWLLPLALDAQNRFPELKNPLPPPLLFFPSPLIEIDNYASVVFDGSASLIWQSNLFYDDEIESDELMFVFTPGLDAHIGNQFTVFEAYFQASYEIQRLDDRSKLNDEYLHVDAIASYEGARFNLNAAYSFDEQQTTTGEQGATGLESGFIRLFVTQAHLLGEYIFSQKFSFEPGITFGDREFQEQKDRLADVRSFSVPLDVFYELTPKVDLSVGYEYTFEEVDISTVENYNRDAQFLNFGARGDLFPKLKGFFKVGYRTVNPEGPNRNSDSTLGIGADFTHLTTPKLTSKLNLRHGFGVGSEGQSAEDTSLKLNFNYIISGNYSARLFTNFTYRNFKDGNDGQDFISRAGLRCLYAPNEHLNFSTGYTYFENDSNRIGQGFVNHILDISASLRY